MTAMESITEFAKEKAGTLCAVCLLAMTIGGYFKEVGKVQGRIEESGRRIQVLEDRQEQLASKSEMGEQYKDVTRRLDRMEDKMDVLVRNEGLPVRTR